MSINFDRRVPPSACTIYMVGLLSVATSIPGTFVLNVRIRFQLCIAIWGTFVSARCSASAIDSATKCCFVDKKIYILPFYFITPPVIEFL